MADETPDATDATDATGDDATTTDTTDTADTADATAVAVEEIPEIDPAIAALFERFEAALGAGVVDHAESFGTLVVRVTPDAWKRSAEVARTDLDCDYLSFVSGIDWMPAPKASGDDGGDTSAPVQPDTMTFGVTGSEGRFQVFAHVQSTSRHWGVTIKTDVSETAPAVDSWVSIYPGADWHERECWEMYGVDFVGHPKIRRLYLPAEFEGNPLRKDFALLAREVKPWPGLVDVEPMPGDTAEEGES